MEWHSAPWPPMTARAGRRDTWGRDGGEGGARGPPPANASHLGVEGVPLAQGQHSPPALAGTVVQIARDFTPPASLPTE